jgi:hypothetical protein
LGDSIHNTVMRENERAINSLEFHIADMEQAGEPLPASPVATPEGWQLVPKQPTEEMIQAAASHVSRLADIDPENTYERRAERHRSRGCAIAMYLDAIDAAPPSPGAAQGMEPPKRFHWHQDDEVFGVMEGPTVDGEWVKWSEVEHLFSSSPPASPAPAREAQSLPALPLMKHATLDAAPFSMTQAEQKAWVTGFNEAVDEANDRHARDVGSNDGR